ncbi:hypothetical protein TNCV_3855251 [Trichonephila clavipes]|nr:hypothetical protein TNCV_3855251 [Trichonephila clavipes]
MAPGRLDGMGSTIGVKYRPRICELSKCLEGPLDRVSQEIAPHTVTPCEIAVCRLDNKCRIGPLAGAPPDTCAVIISTETESGFITKIILQSVTLQVARGRQNPVDTAYDVGSVVSVLADVGPQANFGQSSPYGFS